MRSNTTSTVPCPVRVLVADDFDDCGSSDEDGSEGDFTFSDDIESENENHLGGESWTLSDIAEAVDVAVTNAFDNKLQLEREKNLPLTRAIELLEAKVDALVPRIDALLAAKVVTPIEVAPLHHEVPAKPFKELLVDERTRRADEKRQRIVDDILKTVSLDSEYGYPLPSDYLPDLNTIHNLRCDMSDAIDHFEQALCRAYDGLPVETLDLIGTLVVEAADLSKVTDGDQLSRDFARSATSVTKMSLLVDFNAPTWEPSSSFWKEDSLYADMPPLIAIPKTDLATVLHTRRRAFMETLISGRCAPGTFWGTAVGQVEESELEKID